MKSMPKVGLALGAGGARGLAHIGVLKVLDASGIPIHCITGSSMGSIVAAMYACGVKPDFIGKMADQMRLMKWVDIAVPRMGLAAGRRIAEMYKLVTGNRTFKDCQIPLAIMATDLVKGEPVTITKGPLHEAMLASSALPGIFPPFKRGKQMLVDGGVLERVPIDAARKLGAEVVIAVDVRFASWEPKINNAIDVLFRSYELLEREVGRSIALKADILIHPDLDYIGTLDFAAIEECIQVGEEAAIKALPSIKKLLRRKQG